MVRKVSYPRRVPPKAGVPDGSPMGIFNPLLNFCLSLPWENFIDSPPSVRVRSSPTPKAVIPATPVKQVLALPPKPGAGATYAQGPGCKAADACLLVHGYLVNLAEGKQGFGVLKVAKERLEEGAVGAVRMGQTQVAADMLEVAQGLDQVRTPEAAAALAPRLKELSDQTWDLGRRCGGHLSPQLTPESLAKARELAKRVQDGTMTMEEAVKKVRET